MSRLILVLGMHRSGTSLIAHGLKYLGVELGQRLMGAAPDNPYGFFEDVDILSIDEAVFRATDWAWDRVGSYEHRTMVPASLIRTAKLLLDARLSMFPLFGLKEPRLSRLLWFWKPLFAELGIEVSYIHAIRHPMAVALSLRQRNHIPLDAGLELWSDYVRDMLDQVENNWPVVTIHYDRFVDHTIEEMSRIATTLNLRFDVQAAAWFERHSVARELRHHKSYGLLPSKIADLWESLTPDAVV